MKTILDYSEDEKVRLAQAINEVAALCYNGSAKSGWWTNLETGEPLERNRGEMMCLMHSEISEAMEGMRKNLMDEHLPHRKMEEVEMADVIVRVGDYCGGFSLDLGGALIEKLEYNAHREDHTLEHRAGEGGKAF